MDRYFRHGNSANSDAIGYHLNPNRRKAAAGLQGLPTVEDDISVFSPNGKYLAFARHISPVVAEIHVLKRFLGEGGAVPEVCPIDALGPLELNTPVGLGMGKELLFVGDEPRLGTSNLGMPAFRREEPRLLNQFGEDSSSIAVARERLATRVFERKQGYEHLAHQPSAGEPDTRGIASLSPLIASTRLDTNPQYSRDGKHIAYQSERSGAAEIWICNSDGSASRQLTRLNSKVSGYPRWSPDGSISCFIPDRRIREHFRCRRGNRSLPATDQRDKQRLAPSGHTAESGSYSCSGRNDGHPNMADPRKEDPHVGYHKRWISCIRVG